jgi:hypothetical protein
MSFYEIASSGAIRVVKVVGSSHRKNLDDYVAAWVKVMWKFPPGYEGVFVIR